MLTWEWFSLFLRIKPINLGKYRRWTSIDWSHTSNMWIMTESKDGERLMVTSMPKLRKCLSGGKDLRKKLCWQASSWRKTQSCSLDICRFCLGIRLSIKIVDVSKMGWLNWSTALISKMGLFMRIIVLKGTTNSKKHGIWFLEAHLTTIGLLWAQMKIPSIPNFFLCKWLKTEVTEPEEAQNYSKCTSHTLRARNWRNSS